MGLATDVLMPAGTGPYPAVVLGAEAYGVNSFIRGVQEKLVGLGYAVAMPDYYHGNGPIGTENYDDFTEVIGHIDRLDFTRGARDLAGTVDALRAMPTIDPQRIAVWGYCTGATLAWLAACLRGDLAAAVLYFPSQPVFAELSPARPVHPIDLLWQMTCPALFMYGDQDKLMPADVLAGMCPRDRLLEVNADVEDRPEAGHSFTCPRGPMRNEKADRAAWDDAIAFLSKHMRAAQSAWPAPAGPAIQRSIARRMLCTSRFSTSGSWSRTSRPPALTSPPSSGWKSEPVHSQKLATGETTRFCYSLQGPPYLELVEMTGTGSWSPEQPEGFHHIGVSDPSVPARCAAFGDHVELVAPGDDGSPLVVLTPAEALPRRPRRVLRRGGRGSVPRVPGQPDRRLASQRPPPSSTYP